MKNMIFQKNSLKKLLKNKKTKKIIRIASFLIIVIFATNINAFAGVVNENMDIFEAGKAIGQDFSNDFKGIVNTVAGLAGAICGFIYMTSQDERKVEGAKVWGKRIFIGWVVIIGFPIILNTLEGWFGSVN